MLHSLRSNIETTTPLALVSPVPAKLPRIAVYLPESVKADLEKLATAERRSLSSMVLVAIEEAIKQAKAAGKID